MTTREERWNKRKLAAQAALRGVSPETLNNLKGLSRISKAARAAHDLAFSELLRGAQRVIGPYGEPEAMEFMLREIELEVIAEDERDARKAAA